MGLRTFLGLKRRRFRLDANQKELGGVGPMNIGAAIAAYVAAKPEFFFVQIGAHNAGKGDPLFEPVRRFRLRGLLVEPQLEQFAELRAIYADQPQLAFEQAVIASSNGSAILYKIRPEFWERYGFPKGLATEVSSLDKDHISKHVRLFLSERLARRVDDYLIQEEVPAFTLDGLLAKHAVERVDLLQIDTEGFDFEVIKMIDWDRWRPALLHFETVHLSKDERIAAWALLRAQGYALYATNVCNTLAVAMPAR